MITSKKRKLEKMLIELDAKKRASKLSKIEVMEQQGGLEEPCLPGFEAFLPKASKAPKITPRRATCMLVVQMAGKNVPAESYRKVWGYLYNQLYWRTGTNVRIRAAKSGKSALDEVEEAGLMSDLYAIAMEVYDVVQRTCSKSAG